MRCALHASTRFALVLACLAAACAGHEPGPSDARDAGFTPWPPQLAEQNSGTTQLLQAISVADENTVWISGHGGTYTRTRDGGLTWTAGRVPGADTLQFRDVHALSANTAWLLAAGPADMSRIYRTDDGGANWILQWTNPEPGGFYDCFDFWDANRGVAYGDAVDGHLRVLVTDDGGAHWRRVPDAALPAAQPGEGGFAASGTCVQALGDGRAWIAAGNAARARVFLTTDYGRTWSAAEAPVVSGDAAGLTSISMYDERLGTAFGGNLAVGDRRTDNVVRTVDGGRTWTPLPHVSFDGAIYGGVHSGVSPASLFVVGPGGFAVSRDGGSTWTTVDARAWWGIGGRNPTWIAGPQGRIARIE